MRDRPVLRIKGDPATLRSLPAPRDVAPNGERECAGPNHRGPRTVGIEHFWDRKARVLRKTCGACRHNAKAARRRQTSGRQRRKAVIADRFWTEQAMK